MATASSDWFTLIVRCSDPRLDRFFEQQDHRMSMALLNPSPPLSETYIANVGGLLSFAGADAPRLVHDAALLFGLFGSSSGRIVLTAHTTCGGYGDAVEGPPEAITARQIEDLRTTGHRLSAALPAVPISAYFLDLEDDSVIPIDLG